MESPKVSPWQHLKNFTSTHSKVSVILIVSAFLLGAGGPISAWFFIKPVAAATVTQEDAVEEEVVEEATVQKYYSPLTGVEVVDQATTTRQMTAIMIENSPAARPQSGIKEAGVVFEAIAEGGITRLATLHQEDRPALIGPVRSLRPYYLDWIAPFDASIAHVGGSYNALQTVRDGTFKDIDQFFNGSYYWRSTDRYAPHNVYTNSDLLDELNQSKGYTSSTFTSWPRKAETPLATPIASNIDIEVSSADYNVNYQYDEASNSYIRNVGGEPSLDRELGQVQPKVVVAMKMETQLGWEDGYREQMTTISSNEAYFFQDGNIIHGFWQKNDQKSQILFYDSNAHIVSFNPGQTWITVVAPEKTISWQ